MNNIAKKSYNNLIKHFIIFILLSIIFTLFLIFNNNINASMIGNKSSFINSDDNRFILELKNEYGGDVWGDYWYSFGNSSRRTSGYEKYSVTNNSYYYESWNLGTLNGMPRTTINNEFFGLKFVSETNNQYFEIVGDFIQTPPVPTGFTNTHITISDNIAYRNDYKLVFEYVSGSIEVLPTSNGTYGYFYIPGSQGFNWDELPDSSNPIKEFYFTNDVIQYGDLSFYYDNGNINQPDPHGFNGDYKFRIGIVPRDEVVTTLSGHVFLHDTFDEVWDVENNLLLDTTTYNITGNLLSPTYTHNQLDNPIEYTTISYKSYNDIEAFNDTSLTANYSSGDFEGDSGIIFSYNNARNASEYPIDGGGIILADNTSNLTFTIPHSITNFSFEYRKAFTSVENRNINILINNITESVPTFGSGSGDQSTIYNFDYNVNTIGPVNITIQNIGAHVTIDNISWNYDESLYIYRRFTGYYKQDVLYDGIYNMWGLMYNQSTSIYYDRNFNNTNEIFWTNPKYSVYAFGNLNNAGEFSNKMIYSGTKYSPVYTPLLKWILNYDNNNDKYQYTFTYNQLYSDAVTQYEFSVPDNYISSSNIYFNFILVDGDLPPSYPDGEPFPTPSPDPNPPTVPDSVLINYYIPDVFGSSKLFNYRLVAINDSGPTFAPFINPPLPDNSNLKAWEYYEFSHYEIYGGDYNGITFIFESMDVMRYEDNNILNLIAVFNILEYPIITIDFLATNLNTSVLDLYNTTYVYNNGTNIITAFELPDPNDWSLYFLTYNNPTKYEGYLDDFYFTIYGGTFNNTRVDLFGGDDLRPYIFDDRVKVKLNVDAIRDPDYVRLPGSGSSGSGADKPPTITPPPSYLPDNNINNIFGIILNLFGMNNPAGFIIFFIILVIAFVIITVYFKLNIYFAIIFILFTLILFTFMGLIPMYITITVSLIVAFIILITIRGGNS